MHVYKFQRVRKGVLVISLTSIFPGKFSFFSPFWVLQCEFLGIFCLHVCTLVYVFCLVPCWLCQRCLRLSVCWFVAGTVVSSPASTWQWNAGNRRCRTTNGCNPKWKSMKRKKKPGLLWSNYIRYCEFKACIRARVSSTPMLTLSAAEQSSLALTCCTYCE